MDPAPVQLGVRYEEQRIRLLDDAGAETDHRNQDLLGASAGLVWNLGPDYAITLSAAHSERAPTAQELYSNGPHPATAAFEIGNPALAKERSTGLDLNLRKRTGRVTGAVSLFQNRFHGYVFEEATGAMKEELTVYRFAQRDARFSGGEIETIFHLIEGGPQTLHLRVAADWVRATATGPDEPLPRIPPLRAILGLEWARHDWSAGLEVQCVGPQNRIAPTETRTGGYTLVSAHAGRRFLLGRLNCELFLRGTNLGKEEARAHTSFLKNIAPLPGRNLALGLRATF